MVQNEIGYKVYAGRGDTGPYAIDFEVALDDSGNAKDVKVWHLATGDSLPTDITSTSTFTGLNVYTTDAHIASDTITLIRQPDYKQLSQYEDGDAFPGARTEADFDKIYYLLQLHVQQVARSIKSPVSEAATELLLPVIADRRGKFLAFEDTPQGLPIAALGVPSVPCTAWAATLLDDLTVAAGRTTLDVYSKSEARLRTIHAVSTTPFTVLDDDGYQVLLVTTAASDITINLPTASANTDRPLRIVKVDSGAGTVIVDGEGAELINETTTWVLNAQYQYLQIVCNGTKWVVVACEGTLLELVDISSRSQSNPTANTWYNLGSLSLTVPDGIWEISYFASFGAEAASGTLTALNALATLATAAASETDREFTVMLGYGDNTANLKKSYGDAYRRKKISLAAATTFYINVKTFETMTTGLLYLYGNTGSKTVIRAKRVG
jgi:hypothetical protein